MAQPTLPADVEANVRQSFAAQGMMNTAGAEIIELGAGHCRIAAPIKPQMSQQHGFAHAGLTFALGDSACGYAALSQLPKGQEVLTSEMKIHLLAPARGARLVATGEVIRAGRRLIVTRADVMAEDADGAQSHVATLLGTIVPLAVKP
ncbi:MAG: PaaI family thioesterase [Paracoccaceae bacterium]